MTGLSDPAHYMPDAMRLAAIRSAIDDYNRARPAIKAAADRRALIYLFAYAPVVLAATYAAWQVVTDREWFFLAFLAIVFSVGGVYYLAQAPVAEHQRKLRAALFPEIFVFIDDLAFEKGGRPAFWAAFGKLKLVLFTDMQFDDRISGRHEGLAFELAEVRLASDRDVVEDKIEFDGLILHFSLETPFAGLLLAASRGGAEGFLRRARAFFEADFGAVASGDAELDAAYEFYSDSKALAEPLVMGPLAAAIRWLRSEWNGEGSVQIALSGPDCYLLLPSRKDYFELPGIGQDVDYPHDIEPMIRDMVVMLAVAHLISRVG